MHRTVRKLKDILIISYNNYISITNILIIIKQSTRQSCYQSQQYVYRTVF